ncbi:MAG TPA: ACT domain-containing protein [Candidatus Latescibacteria bacterium]|nr:ACT domain-containing protein [Candidatus Latescibacterota bacterium]
MRGKQLSVFAENKPGKLAEICGTMAEAGINLRALVISSQTDCGILRIVPEDPERAKEVLKKAGYIPVETEVLLVEAQDKLGAMAEIAGKLAEGGVNIDYAYVSSAGGRFLAVLGVSDISKAEGLIG